MRIVLQKYSNQTIYELNPFVTSFTHDMSLDAISSTLTFSIVHNPYDDDLRRMIPEIEVGDSISLFSPIDDPIPNYLVFYGKVNNVGKSNKQGTITYKCYDALYNLGASTTNKIYNTTAENIGLLICQDFNIKSFYFEPTLINIGKQIFENKSYYQILKESYEKAGKALNHKFYIHMDGVTLGVLPLGYPLCVDKLSDGSDDPEVGSAQYSNIIRADKDVDVSDIVNIVKAYDDNGNLIGELRDEESIAHYGIKETTYHQEENINIQDGMRELLKPDPTESITLQTIGFWQWWPGRSVMVHDRETELEGQYVIKRAEHCHEGDHYITNLELELMENSEINKSLEA